MFEKKNSYQNFNGWYLTPNSCLERKLKGIYEKQEKDANDTDGSKISCLTRKNKEVL